MPGRRGGRGKGWESISSISLNSRHPLAVTKIWPISLQNSISLQVVPIFFPHWSPIQGLDLRWAPSRTFSLYPRTLQLLSSCIKLCQLLSLLAVAIYRSPGHSLSQVLRIHISIQMILLTFWPHNIMVLSMPKILSSNPVSATYSHGHALRHCYYQSLIHPPKPQIPTF